MDCRRTTSRIKEVHTTAAAVLWLVVAANALAQADQHGAAGCASAALQLQLSRHATLARHVQHEQHMACACRPERGACTPEREGKVSHLKRKSP